MFGLPKRHRTMLITKQNHLRVIEDFVQAAILLLLLLLLFLNFLSSVLFVLHSFFLFRLSADITPLSPCSPRSSMLFLKFSHFFSRGEKGRRVSGGFRFGLSPLLSEGRKERGCGRDGTVRIPLFPPFPPRG